MSLYRKATEVGGRGSVRRGKRQCKEGEEAGKERGRGSVRRGKRQCKEGEEAV